MENGVTRVMRLRHSCGWLATALLMLPALAWVWTAAGDPVRSVFHCRSTLLASLCNGSLLAERFDICHAGSVFDQPTIGKWLFLFTFMAVTSLPWALAVRWLSDRNKRGAYWAYAICGTLLGILLLCILVWPMVWLGQYVNSMGVTPRRLRGLRWGAAGGLVVITFVTSVFFPLFTSRVKGLKKILLGWASAFSAIAATIGGLFVWVNAPMWAGRFYCLRVVNHSAVAQACGELITQRFVTNRWGMVETSPRNTALPVALQRISARDVKVWTNSVWIVMHDRVNRLGFMENPTNAGVYELRYRDGTALWTNCPVLTTLRLPSGAASADAKEEH
jgi:hypothetical protein